MSGTPVDTRPFFKKGRPAYHTVPIRVRHLRNMRVAAQLFLRPRVGAGSPNPEDSVSRMSVMSR